MNWRAELKDIALVKGINSDERYAPDAWLWPTTSAFRGRSDGAYKKGKTKGARMPKKSDRDRLHVSVCLRSYY